MYRSALRSTPRAAHAFRQSALRTAAPRRFASTSPTEKKRSWKGTALRWGVAIGAVYWYSTSPLFADDTPPQTVQAPPQFSEDDLPTVEAVVEQKRREAEARLAVQAAAEEAKPKGKPNKEVAPPAPAKETNKAGDAGSPAPESGVGGAEDLEAEAGSQGAFNPETGEINWDCPCLGGMAHGPCGEEFKAAFSCFVYSKEEPKGMDCIDKFQNMQNCFREHPEVYADELADDEEDGTEAEGAPEAGAATASAKESAAPSKPAEQQVATKPKQA